MKNLLVSIFITTSISLFSQNISSAKNFLQLKDSLVSKQLFSKIDSVLKIQYPQGKEDTCNSKELTPFILSQIINKTNVDSLQNEKEFTTYLHFNLHCKGYSDNSICKDRIAIQYFEKESSFRLVLDNSYLVDNGCVGGSQISYYFTLKNKKITYLGRQEAG